MAALTGRTAARGPRDCPSQSPSGRSCPTPSSPSRDQWAITPGDEAERARLAERYLGELADRYLEATKGEETVIVRLIPERWRTQDYSKITPL